MVLLSLTPNGVAFEPSAFASSYGATKGKPATGGHTSTVLASITMRMMTIMLGATGMRSCLNGSAAKRLFSHVAAPLKAAGER